MDELNIFTKALNDYAKEHSSEFEDILEDDFIKAVYYIDNLYIANEWDVLTFLSCLNLCNAYAKEFKNHDIYRFKKDIATIIEILNDHHIPNIKMYMTNDKGNMYIFQIANIQFTFHDEKIVPIDEYYQKEMSWDGVRKQLAASTIFNNCIENKNTVRQITTMGKPIKILVNKLIEDYHNKVLTFEEILDSI